MKSRRTDPRRRRASIGNMADTAFEQALALHREQQIRRALGASAAELKAIEARSMIFEDICQFMMAVRGLSQPVKDQIVREIQKTERKRAGAQDKPSGGYTSDPEAHDTQDGGE